MCASSSGHENKGYWKWSLQSKQLWPCAGIPAEQWWCQKKGLKQRILITHYTIKWELGLLLWTVLDYQKSPPILLPQARRVKPSTVLLRLNTTPSMCRRLTTSDAAALISTALTTKPKNAKSWGNREVIRFWGSCHVKVFILTLFYATSQHNKVFI